jgi:hypothetical protein
VPALGRCSFVWRTGFSVLSGDLAGFILVGSDYDRPSVWAVALELIPQWFL